MGNEQSNVTVNTSDNESSDNSSNFADNDYLDGITVLYDEDEISAAVQEVAETIADNYSGKDVVLVCVLKGAVFFMADLSRALNVPHEHRYITANSYLGENSTGKVTITENESLNVEGKHVIIVEDIVDTGLTLKTLMEHIQKRDRPASIECCVLLNKQSRRQHSVDVKYVGIEIEDQFVVGYGLDFNEKYRDLPFIGVYTLPHADDPVNELADEPAQETTLAEVIQAETCSGDSSENSAAEEQPAAPQEYHHECVCGNDC